eukprot:9500201-Pyramimonas_sp.AAC.1
MDTTWGYRQASSRVWRGSCWEALPRQAAHVIFLSGKAKILYLGALARRRRSSGRSRPHTELSIRLSNCLARETVPLP